MLDLFSFNDILYHKSQKISIFHCSIITRTIILIKSNQIIGLFSKNLLAKKKK